MKVIGQKDYFILTSNGDLHLEKSGFDEKRIFEIEGVMTDLSAAPDPKKKHSFITFLQNILAKTRYLRVGYWFAQPTHQATYHAAGLS